MKSRKTCLVTGGAGYVGSTLIRELLASDYNVRCIDMLIYGDKALKGLSNNPRFEFIFGDIRDKKILNSCLSFNPQGIILVGLEHTKKTTNILKQCHIPVIETWDTSTKPIDRLVGFSHNRLGYDITDHMIKKFSSYTFCKNGQKLL